jgi:hypothetical protein
MLNDKWVALTSVESCERSLYIYGAIEAPHGGYTARLAPATVQRAGPTTLLMNLSLQLLPGAWPKGRTLIPVAYEDQLYGGKHQMVKILHDSTLVAQIDVQAAICRTGALV